MDDSLKKEFIRIFDEWHFNNVVRFDHGLLRPLGSVGEDIFNQLEPQIRKAIEAGASEFMKGFEDENPT